MAKGRKPKPAEQKRREGNRGKRKPRSEPEPAGGLPEPPREFDGEHREVWFSILGMLPQYKRTGSDSLALEVFAREVMQYRRAIRTIAKDGDLVSTPQGYQQKHPMHTVKRDALGAIDKWVARFGMSPADRAKLATGDDSDKEDDGDDVEPYTPKLSG